MKHRKHDGKNVGHLCRTKVVHASLRIMGRKINGDRSFKVVASSIPNHKPGGRYFDTKGPYGAGRKAATQLLRNAPPGIHEVRFILRETTNGSEKNVYYYLGRKMITSTKREISLFDAAKNKVVKFQVNDTKLFSLQEEAVKDLIAE